jgi:hypothetical protein
LYPSYTGGGGRRIRHKTQDPIEKQVERKGVETWPKWFFLQSDLGVPSIQEDLGWLMILCDFQARSQKAMHLLPRLLGIFVLRT